MVVMVGDGNRDRRDVREDCHPGRAAGNRAEFPAQPTASSLRNCAYGRPQYTKLSYHFVTLPTIPGLVDGSAEFPCPRRPHADPSIKRMRLGFSVRGGDTFVARLRMRVCAVRGDASVDVVERLLLGGRVFAEHRRSIEFRQRTRCHATRSAGRSGRSSSGSVRTA